MKARLTTLFLFFLVLFCCGLVCKVRAADLASKCSEDFDKVVKCLNFVTAKEATPTKDCCTSISEIRDKNPECLCFFILQTRNGSEQIKNLGIQEARLLQLPTACSLKNASISNCPSKYFSLSLSLPPSLPLSFSRCAILNIDMDRLCMPYYLRSLVCLLTITFSCVIYRVL